MIRDYANAAANERTFLAWVRTGVAIIALGVVVERFNLFLLTIAGVVADSELGARIHRFVSPAGRYGGEGLVGVGVALILVAMYRFLRTARLLSEDATHSMRATRGSLILLALFVLGVAAFSAYLAIG